MGQIGLDELFQMLSGIFTPRAKDADKGELVIVGSGIAPLRQMSLESIQYIRAADIVYHAGQTAAEEAFIGMNAKDSFDLRCLYGPTKPRTDTYVQMAELMMRDVRAGKLVVGLLYGHPGVFATPGHRAIAIAREEGYPAKMLPGISAEDNLIADFGIEPAMPGCAQFEASALIYNKMEVDTKLHTLIWQPGSVGKSTMEMDNGNLYLLIDYLEERYGAQHPIYNYRAGVLPGEASHIEHHTVQEMRDSEVQKSINPGCTLYVPPKEIMATRGDSSSDPVILDLAQEPVEAGVRIELPATSAYRLSHPDLPVSPLYGESEKKAVAALDDYLDFVAKEAASAKKEEEAIPGQYNPNISSSQMQRAAIQLAMNHHMLPSDAQGRAEVVGDILTELSSEEKEAVLSARPFATEGAMRARQSAGTKPTQRHEHSFMALWFLSVMAVPQREVDDGTLVGLA